MIKLTKRQKELRIQELQERRASVKRFRKKKFRRIRRLGLYGRYMFAKLKKKDRIKVTKQDVKDFEIRPLIKKVSKVQLLIIKFKLWLQKFIAIFVPK
jgi:hypothetical protein